MAVPVRPLHESEYWRIEMGGPRLVRATRLDKALSSKEDVEIACAPVQATFDALGRAKHVLLIDVRGVTGNNDPKAEANFAHHRREMVRGFLRAAILLRSTVGKLHTQRLIVEDGTMSMQIQLFLDEQEAIAHLNSFL